MYSSYVCKLNGVDEVTLGWHYTPSTSHCSCWVP